MSMPSANTSPPLTMANASAIAPPPCRSDLTSLPVSSMPAVYRSRSSNSCDARLLTSMPRPMLPLAPGSLEELSDVHRVDVHRDARPGEPVGKRGQQALEAGLVGDAQEELEGVAALDARHGRGLGPEQLAVQRPGHPQPVGRRVRARVGAGAVAGG